MTAGTPERTNDLVASLRSRLERLLPGDGEIVVERFGDGHSNLTFRVDRDGSTWILRRPPLPPYQAGAHDIVREFRILEALAGTGVRVPRPVLLSEADERVEDPAPFYLMEYVDGVVVRDEVPAWMLADGEARRAADDFVEALVELHALDWERAGLTGMARPAPYLERQLKALARLWEKNRRRDLPAVDAAAAMLRRTMPSRSETTLVHGDFKLDNVIFRPSAPGTVAAILDWELATVGDPLADLGFMTAVWTNCGEAADRVLGLSHVTCAPGFPSRDELVARYAARSGRDVDGLAWYQALAVWKLAVILEGSYRRHLEGTTDDPFFVRLRDGIPELGELAVSILRDGGLPSGAPATRAAAAPGG